MKKVGYFFSSFLPVIISVGIQFVATIFLIGVSLFFAYPIAGTPKDISIEELINLWTGSDFSTSIMVIYSLLVICLFSIWYYRNYNWNLIPFRNNVFHPYKLIGVILLIPGTQLFSGYLVAIVAALFPSAMDYYEKLIETAGLSENISVMMLFYSIILAPIGEELIFRGVTMRSAKRAMPFWGANILQAVLFGVYHMNLIQGCYAFALGLILGYICEKGGSIYYAMFLHILFNFWGTEVSQLLGDSESPVVYGVFFFVAIVCTIAGVILFRKGIKNNENQNQGFSNSSQTPII